jgi:hypothetical protein
VDKLFGAAVELAVQSCIECLCQRAADRRAFADAGVAQICTADFEPPVAARNEPVAHALGLFYIGSRQRRRHRQSLRLEFAQYRVELSRRAGSFDKRHHVAGSQHCVFYDLAIALRDP